MYKVLLVDDERQIRQGLRAKINWQDQGFACCGEAADGNEALRLIENERPDVVITDIRMPGMDGVSLLERCQHRYPDVRFVVLSGYEDFQYVKAAMRCGAKDYLLKPVVRKELVERLVKLRIELDARLQEKNEEQQLKRQLNDSLNQLREQFWLHAVRAGTSSDWKWKSEAERLGLTAYIESSLPLCFVTFGVLDLRQSEPQPVRDALLLQAVQMMARELAESWGEPASVFRDPAASERLHMVFQCAAFGEDTLKQWLKQDFQLTIESLLRVRVQMGIGDPVHEFGEWRKGFVTSRIRWMQLAPVEAGGDGATAGTEAVKPEHYELPPVVEKQLTAAIEDGDRSSLTRVLRTVLRTEPPLSLHALNLRVLRLLLFYDGLAWKQGRPLEETQLLINSLPDSLWQCRTPEDAEQLFLQLASSLKEHIRDHDPSGGETIAQRVADYLREHYADEDISLSGMARRFHLHVSYLSEVFKKTTGKNYSEYITEIRIEKAKEWMEHSSLKVAEIAELTGFSNPNYFSQVFKKMTGMSPNEYRTRKN